MATSEEIFAAMSQALEGDEGPVLKKKFRACVVFDLGDEGAWCLDTKQGTLTKEKKGGDLTVTTSLDVLQELLQQKLTPQQAFMKGKIKIKGNMGLAMKLPVVLGATRKHLPGLSKL